MYVATAVDYRPRERTGKGQMAARLVGPLWAVFPARGSSSGAYQPALLAHSVYISTYWTPAKVYEVPNVLDRLRQRN